MIEDGRGFGATLALKHVLGLLERKGMVTHNELTNILDDALEELRTIGERGVIAPAEAAIAGRAIGLLYVRQKPGRGNS
jgi:hypothetical protein